MCHKCLTFTICSISDDETLDMNVKLKYKDAHHYASILMDMIQLILTSNILPEKSQRHKKKLSSSQWQATQATQKNEVMIPFL